MQPIIHDPEALFAARYIVRRAHALKSAACARLIRQSALCRLNSTILPAS